MNKPVMGRPRRRPWDSLPAGKVLSLAEAANLLCVARRTLACSYMSGKRPLPACIEIVRDKNNRVVGIRRNAKKRSRRTGELQVKQ